MKTALLTAALFLLNPAAEAAPSPAPVRAVCDIGVQFGSYAMGIDGRAYDRVQRYTAGHKRLIHGTTVTPWGREGERTVCIDTRSRAATRQVFDDIRRLIGQGQRGPVELRTVDGRVWRSDPGPRR